MANLSKREFSIFQQEKRSGISVKGKDLKRMDIDNCVFENSSFEECSFDRSSISCTRLKNCLFQNCRFRNADLCGCSFVDCVFVDCDFSLAELVDNTISRSKFVNSVFTGADLKENEFEKVEFDVISLRGSATSLNSFRHCTIQSSEFCNCTIEYNIFVQCIFSRSGINAEMLSTCFGVNAESLKDCEFVVLGKKQAICELTTVFELVRGHFESVGQYFNVFTIDINRSSNNLISAIDELCVNMQKGLNQREYIKAAQLTFLFNILKELYRRKQLGYLALEHLREAIRTILNSLPTSNSSYEKIVLLYNNLSLLYNSMIQDFCEISDWEAFVTDRPILARFQFKEKPSVPVVAWLEACYVHTFGNAPEEPPRLVAEQSGSYIAIIQTTVYTLLALRLCTYLLVGITKDTVKLRANASMLTRKKLPRKYYLEATKYESTVTIPEAVAALVSGLLKKVLPKSIANLPALDISGENLSSVTEISEDGSPSKSQPKKDT